MAALRSVVQSTGAVVLIVSGAFFVAAFYPAVDPNWVLRGAVAEPWLARLALAGAGVLGLVLGFGLFAATPQASARAIRGARVPEPVRAREAPEQEAMPVLPTPARRLTKAEEARERLDLEIKAINRKIGKARVMLGMGRLSEEGYTAYVRELEARKAELERERLKHELGAMVRPREPEARAPVTRQ